MCRALALLGVGAIRRRVWAFEPPFQKQWKRFRAVGGFLRRTGHAVSSQAQGTAAMTPSQLAALQHLFGRVQTLSTPSDAEAGCHFRGSDASSGWFMQINPLSRGQQVHAADISHDEEDVVLGVEMKSTSAGNSYSSWREHVLCVTLYAGTTVVTLATLRLGRGGSVIAADTDGLGELSHAAKASMGPLANANTHPLCVVSVALALVGDPVCSRIISLIDGLYRNLF